MRPHPVYVKCTYKENTSYKSCNNGKKIRTDDSCAGAFDEKLLSYYICMRAYVKKRKSDDTLSKKNM